MVWNISLDSQYEGGRESHLHLLHQAGFSGLHHCSVALHRGVGVVQLLCQITALLLGGAQAISHLLQLSLQLAVLLLGGRSRGYGTEKTVV